MARYIVKANTMSEMEAYGHLSKAASWAIRDGKVPVGARLITREEMELLLNIRIISEIEKERLLNRMFGKRKSNLNTRKA